MSEKKNNNQPENNDDQVSNYEELLNGFSDGEEVKDQEAKESEEGIALPELLDGIDSQEGKVESDKDSVPDESEEFNLDEISDINLDDITSKDVDVTDVIEGTETEDETISKTDSGKFKIDLDALEEGDSGDYSSVLSEIDGGEPSETGGELSEGDLTEMKAEEAPAEAPAKEIAMEIEEFETSYASLIDEESAEEGAEVPEPLENIEETEAEEAPAEEIAMEIEETETSYASLIDEESAEPSSGEITMEIESEGSDKEVFEKLADNEYSLEDEEAGLEPEEEFSLPEEPEEEAVIPEFSADEKTEETFVISGDESEESEEEDFLSLEEDTSSGDDLLAGVTDVKESAPTEVMLEGIEMDAEEQISTVTRAELLLAQGKEKEAAELFTGISDKKGVTPWVSKRLSFLNIQGPTPESETEGETEDETEKES